MKTDILILAAGQGSRMKSRLPKVLHKLAGKPMLAHVITAAQEARPASDQGSTCIVIGHGADTVKQTIGNPSVDWCLQKEQLGTGHAVRQALPHLNNTDTLLVLYGDVPMIKSDTIQSLVQACNGERLAILTAYLPDPTGYGRIVRNNADEIQSIVEQKDATPKQQQINEINTGIMAIPGHNVRSWIDLLQNDNAQGEYYLTDIVAMAVKDNIPVIAIHPEQAIEIQGINSPSQLAELERSYQQQMAEQLLADGVTLMDPARLDIRGNLKTGTDVVIDINVVFEGDVTLGNNVTVEPGCIIRNAVIGDNTLVKAYSVIEEASIDTHCEVGPFSRLRPQAHLHNHARVGNFVEIKKSSIGQHSKVNHLTYIGDSVMGEGVNIGAGTVTCNYDGAHKHQTHIGDNAFIGTNNSLIAPVSVGTGATTGAGSTISKDVPDDKLAIARAKQRTIEGWQRPVKK
ncbi:Bifunctional protein GlmU [invertebrate metagenome]|uniref:Bifunctional protein GlmU n=1 Tax=invertebrate metagenome TaxID=1711999 RepID=A0A2H9T8B8_9ZZZZ